MHLTHIVLKDGRKFSSPIHKIRFAPDIFENSYIELFDYEEKFYIKNIESAITKNERISKYKCGDCDEIGRMKKMWDDYKDEEIMEEIFPLPE